LPHGGSFPTVLARALEEPERFRGGEFPLFNAGKDEVRVFGLESKHASLPPLGVVPWVFVSLFPVC